MSSLEGKLLVCDMCEDKLFLKLIEERPREWSNFKDKIYQDAPEGWTRANLGKGWVDICPNCAKAFNEWFNEKIKKEKEND